MPYEITITQTRPLKRIIGKRWAKIGTKEVERDAAFMNGADLSSYTRIEDVMGYTPEVESIEDVKRTVLMQEVDELDLCAVIRAINGI